MAWIEQRRAFCSTDTLKGNWFKLLSPSSWLNNDKWCSASYYMTTWSYVRDNINRAGVQSTASSSFSAPHLTSWYVLLSGHLKAEHLNYYYGLLPVKLIVCSICARCKCGTGHGTRRYESGGKLHNIKWSGFNFEKIIKE